ncbi:hypothetical protein AVEN_265019-1 [Araneus ventricosus]|uniref:Uncharacterized protein n=1 Tax=Araneus ventricosus TaxID=182803 RepID=A0A4Y2EL49_ARAVE|nr:hypothetical protein AVEN_265019-1 [Araneus ventricosus]
MQDNEDEAVQVNHPDQDEDFLEGGSPEQARNAARDPQEDIKDREAFLGRLSRSIGSRRRSTRKQGSQAGRKRSQSRKNSGSGRSGGATTPMPDPLSGPVPFTANNKSTEKKAWQWK